MPALQFNGLRLHYRLDGPEQAPVLVLSNSLGTDLNMWAPQMPELAARFRVLRYDARGHGRSGLTPGPYAIDQLAGDVLRLLDALGIARAHFCGLSIGGMVGMWLGLRAPERIDRLVLCNTAAKIGTREMWNARIEAVRRGGMASVVEAVMDRWFTAAFRRRAPEAVRGVREAFLATDPEGYAACCAAVRDMDQRAELAGIRRPTLVIGASHDGATPPEDGLYVAEQIRGARYLELDAAHLSNIEDALRFTAAVREFLSNSEET